jgi:hypothetical protein
VSSVDRLTLTGRRRGPPSSPPHSESGPPPTKQEAARTRTETEVIRTILTQKGEAGVPDLAVNGTPLPATPGLRPGRTLPHKSN